MAKCKATAAAETPAARLDAEHVFAEVRSMPREAKGLGRPKIPF